VLNAFAPMMVHIGRAEITQALTSAGYLLVSAMCMWLALDGDFTRTPAIAAAAVALVGAAIAWFLSNRRWHLIHDTPTARVRSAAQGYVELVGVAALSPGQAPLAFNGLPPCVWFQVIISDAGDGTERATTWTRVSDETFVLRDDTGDCVIDPDHAEVHMAHVRRWRMGTRRYQARFLMQGDTLYAIGALETLRPADGGLDRRADVAHLLRQWKRDPRSLHREYDHNRDGQLDPEEWQQAVVDAERIVDAQHKDLQGHPAVHVMRAPGDRLPYVISNRDPEALAARFRQWSWFHAAVFVTALTGIGWLAMS
jgi:hypothetical protein